jgi:ferritin
MSSLDSDIFGDKKLKDLFQEIYQNQKKKERQISTLIEELKPLIDDIGDATLVVPLIKEYLELGVKNDEQLIKMATIIQRCLAANNNDGESTLLISDEEKAQLLGEINKIQENIDKDEKH